VRDDIGSCSSDVGVQSNDSGTSALKLPGHLSEGVIGDTRSVTSQPRGVLANLLDWPKPLANFFFNRLAHLTDHSLRDGQEPLFQRTDLPVHAEDGFLRVMDDPICPINCGPRSVSSRLTQQNLISVALNGVDSALHQAARIFERFLFYLEPLLLDRQA